MNHDEFWGPFSLWDPLAPYRFRGFRVAPGELVVFGSEDAHLYVNRVPVKTVSGAALAPILAAVDRGDWQELTREEVWEFRQTARNPHWIASAEQHAAFVTSPVEVAFRAQLARENLPAAPAENLARIRSLVRTWRR